MGSSLGSTTAVVGSMEAMDTVTAAIRRAHRPGSTPATGRCGALGRRFSAPTCVAQCPAVHTAPYVLAGRRALYGPTAEPRGPLSVPATESVAGTLKAT